MNNNGNCTLLALDVPAGTDIGINLMQIQVGPKFRGIGLIPAGTTFLSFSSHGELRQGYFIILKESETIVRSWNVDHELLAAQCTLSEQSKSQLFTDLYHGLLNDSIGAYDVSNHHQWANLSGLVSVDVLLRSECIDSKGNSVTLFPGDDNDEILYQNEAEKQLSVQPYFSDLARVARFVNIRQLEKDYLNQLCRISATEITKFHQDKSSFLSALLISEYEGQWTLLLGEFQLAFVLFLQLRSLSAFRSWQFALSVISSSGNYLRSNSPFTNTFLRVLFHQLHLAPEEFFADELFKDSFLSTCLTNLLVTVHADGIEEIDAEQIEENEVKRRFLTFLQKRFDIFHEDSSHVVQFKEEIKKHWKVKGQNDVGVELNDEQWFGLDEEDIPTIVDIDEVERIMEGSERMDTMDSCETVSTVVPVPMTSVEKEALMYSWRYPMLYDAMVAKKGTCDMVMTAREIIDMTSGDDQTVNKALYAEALGFIEHEIVKQCS